MIREIVKIDEEKCNGCGLCIPNCVEGALKIVNGKAKLVSDVYCDGLGACLGHCPEDAISIVKRDAVEFDEEAVEEFLKSNNSADKPIPDISVAGGCPGSALRSFEQSQPHHKAGGGCPGSALMNMVQEETAQADEAAPSSQLTHWPVQLMLVPPSAPFLKGRNLVISADCAPFAIADFHKRYLSDRAVVVGCPKLDDLGFYRQKLLQIFGEAQPSAITVLRMEVPCCSGIAHAVMEAREQAVPDCPLEVHTIGIKGDIRVEAVPARS